MTAARQQRYGVIGIYGPVADNLRLIHRSTMDLTPDRGRRLADAFRDGTAVPNEVIRALFGQQGGRVVREVANVGKRARIDGRLLAGLVAFTPSSRRFRSWGRRP